ncbi:hypothetical protein HOD75_03465 [archaeon]|jgi:hypothetical protein|nr:hypothetical protein [archaeon]MBT4241932.1 hypothetical protein [archaeon]MBT4418479.1 hypothetical protein [archaeon]
MKILIVCSKHFYHRIPEIQQPLETAGHELSMPNSYDEPLKEEDMKVRGLEAHVEWKAEMLRRDEENIQPQDALLVLNFEKKGQPNYIGGATFLEIYTAWKMDKKVFLYNPIPQNIFEDELTGMSPTILNQDLSQIK